MPYVGLGTMAFLVDDLGCHPVRRAPHGAQHQRTGAVRGHIHTQLLGTAEVDQLDDSVRHQHHVAALYVPVSHRTKCCCSVTLALYTVKVKTDMLEVYFYCYF